MAPCDLHLVTNCQLCAKKPSAAPPAIAPAPNTVPSPNPSVNAVSPAPYIPAPSTISDPHASKVLAAANKYAAECDNYTKISAEVKSLEVQLLDAKNRLSAAAKSRDEAQKEMVALIGGKS